MVEFDGQQTRKKLVLKHFKSRIRLSKPSKKEKCEKLIAENEILQDLGWIGIKICVFNTYRNK